MNRYLTASRDKSRRRHVSTAALSSALTLLISAADILRPINLSEIIDNVRVLIPAKNKMLKSRATSSSYCLLRGITEDRSRIRTGYGPENITRLRRFAIGIIKSKKVPNVAQKMRELTRNVRLVFDYLRMTSNSCHAHT